MLVEIQKKVKRKSTIIFYERLMLKIGQNSSKSRKLTNYFELVIHKKCSIYI